MASPHHHHHPPPAASSSSSSSSSGRALLDLEVTVVSAKQLKNVNWRQGELKPYAVAYLDSDRRGATKPDDAGSTRPVWNERLLLPLPLAFDPLDPSLVLTLDLFHSKPSEAPKPLVGTARCPLKDLLLPLDPSPAPSPSPVKTLELRRPSGRPQGKVRIRLAVRERPDPNYQFAPPSAYYYSRPPPAPAPPATTAPTLLPLRLSRPTPTLFPRPSRRRTPTAAAALAAAEAAASSSASAAATPPIPTPDTTRPPPPSTRHPCFPAGRPDEARAKGGRSGLGTGLAVGAVAGALGGLALDEGLKYEEEKIAERVESDFAPRDDYSDYRADY
uniref:C2 domain-containing protein n=1 Tax=Ananas comosus var. bracteatus TaxID=296719 RepID=A0A6V7QVN1_ANACO